MNELAESNNKSGKLILLEIKQNYSEMSVKKIAEELEKFSGGQKEKAVSKFVASTLTHFCSQNERFAEVVYKTQRTLSDCCEEVMHGTGNSVSDIDVYRKAVQSYFPNADISFKMEILIFGEAPSEEEINRVHEVKTPKQTKQSKKNAAAEESDVEENDDDDDDEMEVAASVKARDEKPKRNNPPKETKAPKETKKPKQEIIQLSLFESMFGEEK